MLALALPRKYPKCILQPELEEPELEFHPPKNLSISSNSNLNQIMIMITTLAPGCSVGGVNIMEPKKPDNKIKEAVPAESMAKTAGDDKTPVAS